MTSITKVLSLMLITISANAISLGVMDGKQTVDMHSNVNQNPTAETANDELREAMGLRNGNYALACQNDQLTYVAGMLNYIYSPVIAVPVGNNVAFDFFIRGAFSDPDVYPAVDYWGCEVSPDAGNTWYAISNPYGDPNGSNYVYSDAPADWSSFVASYSPDGLLNSYSGFNLQFRWYLRSDEDTPVGEGIFIDDIVLSAK